LFTEFEDIRKLRNDLAHSTIDVPREARLRGLTSVGFVNFKDGEQKVRTITTQEADDYDAKIGTLLGKLGDIAKILGLPATFARGEPPSRS
jgi:hypothetical protein